MTNYQFGKIYRIIDKTNKNQYICSTCCPTLAQRLRKHKDGFAAHLKGMKL